MKDRGKPVFGSKKGLAEIGEAFEKVKFCRVSLESHNAFGVELIYIVIISTIIDACMT